MYFLLFGWFPIIFDSWNPNFPYKPGNSFPYLKPWKILFSLENISTPHLVLVKNQEKLYRASPSPAIIKLPSQLTSTLCHASTSFGDIQCSSLTKKMIRCEIVHKMPNGVHTFSLILNQTQSFFLILRHLPPSIIDLEKVTTSHLHRCSKI